MSKSFNYPVTAENLEEFCWPVAGDVFSSPFKWGEDEDVGVCNGLVAIRVRSFVDCDRESLKAVERIERRPWGFFEMNLSENNWGMLDTRLGGLWKHGPSPMLGVSPAGKPYPRKLFLIGVGDCTVVSKGVLQAISKLPRSKVYTTGRNADPLFFEFNGGIGIAATNQHELRKPRYSIFQKDTGLF